MWPGDFKCVICYLSYSKIKYTSVYYIDHCSFFTFSYPPNRLPWSCPLRTTPLRHGPSCYTNLLNLWMSCGLSITTQKTTTPHDMHCAPFSIHWKETQNLLKQKCRSYGPLSRKRPHLRSKKVMSFLCGGIVRPRKKATECYSQFIGRDITAATQTIKHVIFISGLFTASIPHHSLKSTPFSIRFFEPQATTNNTTKNSIYLGPSGVLPRKVKRRT